MAKKKALTKVGLQYLWGRIKALFVAKVDGKGLSTNDLTDELLAQIGKVAGLETTVENLVNGGGEPNVIEAVKVNGTALAVADKAVDVAVPTKTSDLANDSGFITGAEADAKIAEGLAEITSFDLQKVSELPSTGEKGTLYLLPNTGEGRNTFDEYVWLNRGTAESPDYGWEKLGTVEIDLTGYLKEEDIEAITTEEIDEITSA